MANNKPLAVNQRDLDEARRKQQEIFEAAFKESPQLEGAIPLDFNNPVIPIDFTKED